MRQDSMSGWRRMAASFKKVIMVSVLACAVIGLLPTPAAAQQDCIAWGDIWRSGTQRVTGNTYLLGPCTGYGFYIGTYFVGRLSNVLCGEGAVYVGGGQCRNTGTGENEKLSSTRFNGCGYYTARTRHYAWRIHDGVITWYLIKQHDEPFGYSCDQANYGCDAGEVYVEPDGCIPYNTPIIVPLSRSQDYHLTSVADGVQFDMNGDGVKEQTAWTAPGSRLAFLALDRNGNGVIDDGRELMGNNTVERKSNGFEVLISFALGGKQTPDLLVAGHPTFDALLLWEDRNHDGVSQADEVQRASNLLSEVGIGYDVHNRRDRFGNLFRFEGWASIRTGPGVNTTTSHENMVERNIKLYDVLLRVQ